MVLTAAVRILKFNLLINLFFKKLGSVYNFGCYLVLLKQKIVVVLWRVWATRRVVQVMGITLLEVIHIRSLSTINAFARNGPS
jgi:hypothetical protein